MEYSLNDFCSWIYSNINGAHYWKPLTIKILQWFVNFSKLPTATFWWHYNIFVFAKTFIMVDTLWKNVICFLTHSIKITVSHWMALHSNETKIALEAKFTSWENLLHELMEGIGAPIHMQPCTRNCRERTHLSKMHLVSYTFNHITSVD